MSLALPFCSVSCSGSVHLLTKKYTTAKPPAKAAPTPAAPAKAAAEAAHLEAEHRLEQAREAQKDAANHVREQAILDVLNQATDIADRVAAKAELLREEAQLLDEKIPSVHSPTLLVSKHSVFEGLRPYMKKEMWRPCARSAGFGIALNDRNCNLLLGERWKNRDRQSAAQPHGRIWPGRLLEIWPRLQGPCAE